jgi:hypothetical protein
MPKWLIRKPLKKKPTRLKERWTKLTDLSTPFKITRSDGKPPPKNSNHLSKGLLVMLPKLALSSLTVVHSTLSSEVNSLMSTSITISWPKRFLSQMVSS